MTYKGFELNKGLGWEVKKDGKIHGYFATKELAKGYINNYIKTLKE